MKLPQDIQDEFQPFESINVANNRYMATPIFVEYPDNDFLNKSGVGIRTSADGRKWMCRRYSPNCGEDDKGTYAVAFCEITQNPHVAKLLHDLKFAFEEYGRRSGHATTYCYVDIDNPCAGAETYEFDQGEFKHVEGSWKNGNVLTIGRG